MSKKPPNITFFIDRSLSQWLVAEALRAKGATAEAHDDHFANSALDVEWLPVVSQRGWVVVTKDWGLSSNILEIRAIAAAGARVFLLPAGNFTGPEMAAIAVAGLDRMQKFVQGNQAPFIARVNSKGHVRMWRNRTKLGKYLKSADS